VSFPDARGRGDPECALGRIAVLGSVIGAYRKPRYKIQIPRFARYTAR